MGNIRAQRADIADLTRRRGTTETVSERNNNNNMYTGIYTGGSMVPRVAGLVVFQPADTLYKIKMLFLHLYLNRELSVYSSKAETLILVIFL